MKLEIETTFVLGDVVFMPGTGNPRVPVRCVVECLRVWPGEVEYVVRDDDGYPHIVGEGWMSWTYADCEALIYNSRLAARYPIDEDALRMRIVSGGLPSLGKRA